MKNFLTAMIIFYVMIFSANCQAESVTEINPMIGDWYDINGNLALRIGSDYSINGCKIFDLKVRGEGRIIGNVEYILKILEKNGYRNMSIEYHYSYKAESFSEEDYHEMIAIDHKTVYFREKNRRHFESIGGIYLGMKKSEVLKLYGQPSSIQKAGSEFNCVTFKYAKEGFDVTLYGDAVISIIIYDYGDRRFDWSGLSARDSIDTFKKFYGYSPEKDSGIVNFAFYIGHGEALVFSRKGDKTRWVALC